MADWFLPALLSLITFGLWGLFSKLSLHYIDSKSALVYQCIGVFIVGVIILTQLNFKPAVGLKGFSFAIMTGMMSAIGCFFYFIAVDRGKLTTVVTMTALYPAITMIFAFVLLDETLNFKQCLGIVLGLAAIFLMSS